MNNEQYVIGLMVGRNDGDYMHSVRVYDFSKYLGGNRDVLDYDCFSKLRELSQDPVELWQTVPAHFDGVSDLIMLVDEEGLLHDPQDPANFVATISANIGYPICGDTFVCKTQGEDMQFLTTKELRAICRNFSMDIPKAIIVV